MASAEVCDTLPKNTWSTSSGWTPARSSAAFAATTPRSVAVKSLRDPPKLPNGVRAPPRNTISWLGEPFFMTAHSWRSARGTLLPKIGGHVNVSPYLGGEEDSRSGRVVPLRALYAEGVLS